jgi:hypothetical protein
MEVFVMSLLLSITANNDGGGLLDEFGKDSEWAYWNDNADDDQAYRDLLADNEQDDVQPL